MDTAVVHSEFAHFPMTRVVKYWAIAGAVVPALIISIAQFEKQGRVFYWLDYVGMVLWPSWILNAAAHGREFTIFGIVVLVISIVINMIVYSVVGAVVWWLFVQFRK